MNCQTAHQLLSAERDGALLSDQRIALEAHLGDCPACQNTRAMLAVSIAAWRTTTTSAKVPDVERAWHDIRRETRTARMSRSAASRGVLRWLAPLGVAAGLAWIASVAPRWQNHAQAAQIFPREIASADFVDVPSNASSMVYVDDQSGWLVVWSDGDSQPSGG